MSKTDLSFCNMDARRVRKTKCERVLSSCNAKRPQSLNAASEHVMKRNL